MKMLDMPGAAAPDGSDDKRVVPGAAWQAGLILLPVTDDAPQPAESECLDELRSTGYPVPGICNAKGAVNSWVRLRSFLRSLQTLFGQDKPDGIDSQLWGMPPPGVRPTRGVQVH